MATLLVALAVALHAPTLGHRFLLDDGVQIYRNPAVTRGAPLSAYFLDRETTSSRPDYNTRIYRPLRNLAFRVVVLLGGVRPIAFGLANLLCYALATLLVLKLLRRLVADPVAAAWATAVWVALPIHAEPVAYASSLGDLLSLVFELGALTVALPLLADGSGADAGDSDGTTRPDRWRFVASTALAAAAMLTKEMAITAPAIVLLVALARRPGAWRTRNLRLLVALHALVAIGYLALRTSVVHAVGQSPVTAATVRTGLRDAPWLLAHYFRITVQPLGHAASYQVAPPGALALGLTLVALCAVALLAWRWRRTVAVGLAWFAVALLPVLHLVPIDADLADRFTLFPSVGLALALAAALAPIERRIAHVALAATVALFGAATLVEARAWRSDALLWRYAVDRQPQATLAHSNLAAVLLGEGRLDEALTQLETLEALDYARADLELKRGYILFRLGRPDEAARAVARALRLEPTYGQAYALAGQLALATHDLPGATQALGSARRLSPSQPSVGLLGYLVLRARGDAGVAADDARVDYLRALQAISFDDADGAASAARDCLRHSPGRPQCEAILGQALLLQGPVTPEVRALLERAMAALPEGADRRRCQEALWGAR
jgi:tetratricopeptide (TPR) repeat protein